MFQHDQLDKFGLNYSTREEENHLFLCLCDGNRIQVDMAVAQLLSPLPIQVTHIPLEIIGKWNLHDKRHTYCFASLVSALERPLGALGFAFPSFAFALPSFSSDFFSPLFAVFF